MRQPRKAVANGPLTSWHGRIGIVDLGDWSIRNWRTLAGLTSALLVVSGGLAGSITDYRSYFPALGGPNGLLYDLTLKVAQPCAATPHRARGVRRH